MSFGTVALIILGGWSLMSIIVTVGLGAVIDRRDADRLHTVSRVGRERAVDRIAS